MAEEISNPLLSLIREQGLVDDLQYEDVIGEIKRSGKPVFQILQDFGILDADSILQAMANDQVSLSFQVCSMICLAGFFEDVNLLTNSLKCFSEFIVVKFQIFFWQS